MNAKTYSHDIKLSLEQFISLLFAHIWLTQRKAIKQQSCCVGPHTCIGHLDGEEEKVFP